VADDRKHPPLIDLAAVLVSPVLIMMMLGSLVFFLIEVLYAGQYEGRLVYTFFFYVIGCVLIGRIAIRFGTQRAAIYTVGLGAACFLAMLAFVEYPTALFRAIGPVINLFLMALVWWAANKLTWDCTHLDEDQKSSGRGLLAAAGLDGTPSATAADDEEEFDPDRSTTATGKKKEAKPAGWLERWQKYREWQKKKPHTPGIWVLYFALAALPLFALGQSVIPADDNARRGAAFWQMAMYIGSALGLLVTTSLLGLRRYLEARNARLPTAMTAGWLGLGFAMIVTFLACGALLPRPHSETPLFTFNKGGKSNRSASKYAQVRDNSAGKGEGNSGTKTEKGQGNASGKNGEAGGKSGAKNSGGQNKGGSSAGKNSGDKSGSKGEQGKSGNDSSKNKSDGQSKGDDSKSKGDDKSSDSGDDAENKDNDNPDDDGKSSSSSRTSEITAGLEKVAAGVKWLVWIVLAVAVVGGAIWFVLRGLAPFTNWARGLLDWWRNLFGAKKVTKASAQAEEAAVEAEVLRPPPFSMFANPFTDGSASRREPGELTEYSYAALDSWAWDHAQGRQPEETPSEFVARLSEDFPEFQIPGQAVVKLLMRVLYSPGGPLPGDAKARLEAFWKVLESVEASVMG